MIEKWEYVLKFKTELGNHHELRNNQIVKFFSSEYNDSAHIINAAIYKSPLHCLSDLGLTGIVPQSAQKSHLHHQFVIFQTRDGHSWCLEKDRDAIHLSRSGEPHHTSLKDFAERSHEGTFEEMGRCEVDLSLHGLVQQIKEGNFVNTRYNALLDNCQHFAKSIFNSLQKPRQL